MASILVLNGPNLNLLGTRQPKIYGGASLMQINAKLSELGQQFKHNLTFKQHNCEGDFINSIQQAKNDHVDVMLINAAALTHTSIAIRDAILAVAIPFVEVHLSNVHQRETFRHHSYLSDIAIGVITGFGAYSYELAMLAAHNYLKTL